DALLRMPCNREDIAAATKLHWIQQGSVTFAGCSEVAEHTSARQPVPQKLLLFAGGCQAWLLNFGGGASHMRRNWHRRGVLGGLSAAPLAGPAWALDQVSFKVPDGACDCHHHVY